MLQVRRKQNLLWDGRTSPSRASFRNYRVRQAQAEYQETQGSGESQLLRHKIIDEADWLIRLIRMAGGQARTPFRTS
jgi:hypothetical protein